MLSNMNRPSVLPSTDSEARSGWGMRPATLRDTLQIPAMFSREPLGLDSSVIRPCASQYCQRIC